MDYIRKIPILLGLGSALLIGIIGYISKTPNRENILNMLIGMIVFYTVGIIVRNTLKSIIETTMIKIVKKNEETKRLELEKQKEEERIQRQKEKGNSLDLVADDSIGLDNMDEDFDALPVAEFIRKELK